MSVASLAVLALLAAAQEAAPEVRVETARGNVFVITGSGGNVGLVAGDDGAFLIDDQYAPLTEAILAAVKSKTDAPVRFVVNTHWHQDHTGGNENLGEAGVLIVAHENVRKRMSAGQFMAAFGRQVPPAPETALPVVTFADSMTFHWNGERIDVRHLGPAHTDGDSVIWFREADVLHTGDLFFNGLYPLIDASSGGSLDGMIAAADELLGEVGDETVIIPGHGPLARKADLAAFRDMLVGVRDALRPLVDEGRSVDEIVAAKPTAEFDAEWGGGFLAPDEFVRITVAAMRGDGD